MAGSVFSDFGKVLVLVWNRTHILQRKEQAGPQATIKLLGEGDLCQLKRESQSNFKVLELFP